MRTAFILTFIMNLILLGVSIGISPARVAIHFGSGGVPDNWASSQINALTMAGVHLLLFVSLLFSAKLLSILPRKYISIPNKSYWIQDENWVEAKTILAKEIYLFGTVIFIFMFIAGLLSLQANLSTPVQFREDLFWWPFGLFIIFNIYWIIRLIIRFKIPEKKTESSM